ncbi:MAG: hypothetical protein HQK70_07405 [Desulfamplus sp.]|nr:hypothetical protein [Desulfamplus sp.]
MTQSNLKESYSKSSIIGVSIIVLLIVIAVFIFREQFNFNPAVTALSEKVALSESNLNGPDSSFGMLGGSGQYSENTDSLSQDLKSEEITSVIRLIKPLVPLTAPESFNAETLSDKINGKAELYLPAGFKSLVCQRFKISTNSDSKKFSEISEPSSNLDNSSHQTVDFSDKLWIEVFVYDMTLPENAFAVFSRQRREGSIPVLITQYAYQTENALFFVHGHFYVEMIASEPSENGVKLMTELGKTFIEDRPALASKKMEVPDLFPVKGLDLDKESITLISSDAFGFDRFDNIYTAIYTLKGSKTNKNDSTANKTDINSSNSSTTITAFISKRDSSEKAAKLVSEYAEFLVNFGGNKTDSGIDGVYAIEIMDTIELIFCSGQYIAGVRDSESLEISKHLVRNIKSRLDGVN